jgi:transcriptional regulator with GAF, ATPase, and Fis domain
MAAKAIWASEPPAVNRTESIEVEDAALEEVTLDGALPGSGFPRIVGKSAAFKRVLGMVRVVAPTNATVLIHGETGTGKELIAEAIHKCSDRARCPS